MDDNDDTLLKIVSFFSIAVMDAFGKTFVKATKNSPEPQDGYKIRFGGEDK